MRMTGRLFTTGLGVAVLLTSLAPHAWSQVAVGSGGGGFGGELKGPTIVGGRVICAQCTIRDVEAAQPHLTNLYELRHPQEGKVVMQIAPLPDTTAYYSWWHSDGAIWWQAIVGPGNSLTVRTPNYLFRQLMAEENLLKQVELVGLLGRSRTYDVASVNYLDSTPSPLASARRAQAAAERADTAAERAQGAAKRAANAADRLTAMTNTAENQFATSLVK